MNKYNLKNYLEYLALLLTLSYLIIQNIFLVLTGIIISLYLININSINKIIRIIIKIIDSKKVSIDINNEKMDIIPDSHNLKLSKEESNPTLVETIEELGYIPSKNEKNNRAAA